MKKTLLTAALCATLTLPAYAQHEHQHHHNHANHTNHDQHVHLGNVPAGIMGDHVHGKGDWMFSYRAMTMHMDGNRDGTNGLSPSEISGNFANVTGVGPATLRIVPTQMDMDMHMFGGMVGVTDKITLMLMGSYLNNEMDHITFAGGNPALEIGRFTTKSSGLGDTKVAALFNAAPKIVAKIGVSLPTGSIEETGTILNPLGAAQTVRLPYAMQLGSGTYDLEPAMTYTDSVNAWDWGAQYKGVIRIGENENDYAFGDKHSVSAWGGYRWNKNVQTTARLTGEHEGQIEGRDTSIAGPVQTANPDNYGGRRVELGLGLNLYGTKGYLKNQALAIEATTPLYQNLNGPQLERDYTLGLAYKVAF